MKFLITAGPTREPIDPVRYLSNRSSGRMGYALAEAARDAGHEVTLVSGPVSLEPPRGVTIIPVITAEEMYHAVHEAMGGIDVAILAAAVADYRPVQIADQKMKKSGKAITLELEPTRDILASLGAMIERRFLLVGFAAETERLAEYAQKKLRKKNCDLIVANLVSAPGIGFDSTENEVTVFSRASAPVMLRKASKQEISRAILEIVVSQGRGGFYAD